ncbi:hypothetical protein J2S01_000470 [Pectinatus haikarae]|uniref:Uncharacterized protein n=1 Tax=Pectinatus haikarae TaxID=349096 RepID=A0ABT9Y4M7_9FIRM|nr:hypothetical protein [Pectinatus haikarae]
MNGELSFGRKAFKLAVHSLHPAAASKEKHLDMQ